MNWNISVQRNTASSRNKQGNSICTKLEQNFELKRSMLMHFCTVCVCWMLDVECSRSLNVVVWCSKYEYLYSTTTYIGIMTQPQTRLSIVSLYSEFKYQLTNARPHAWLQLQHIISSTSNTICTFHSHKCVSTEGSTRWKNSPFIWSPIYTFWAIQYYYFDCICMVRCVLVFRIRM